MPKILLFIPAYNCEKQIVRVLKQLDDNILGYISQIVVVNNRSTDNTEEAVRQYLTQNKQLPLRLLRNKDNYNLGGSHKVAFKYAIQNGFDYIIVLHGDDQGNIHDLLPILRKGIYKRHDCCLGARFIRGSSLEGYSAFRTLGNVVFNLFFSFILWHRIYDLGSGLNIYNVDMLKTEFYQRFPDKLTFNCYMLLAAHYYKHDIYFFPITWREDDQVSNVKIVRQAFNTLVLLLSYLFKKDAYLLSELRETPVEGYEADDVTTIKELYNEF